MSRTTTFDATVDSIEPAWGRLTLVNSKTGRSGEWEMGGDAWKTQRICRALTYRFRADTNGARRIVSWYPKAPASPQEVARFLSYCGVADAKRLAKTVDPNGLLADPAAEIDRVGGGVEEAASAALSAYLPAGYAPLAKLLFDKGATGSVIASIHAALVERCAAPENYLAWLERWALSLAEDETVGPGSFELLDRLAEEASEEERIVAAAQCVLMRQERYGHTMASAGMVEHAAAKLTGASVEEVRKAIEAHRSHNKGASGEDDGGDRSRLFDLTYLADTEREGKWKAQLSRDATSLRENVAAKGLAHVASQRPQHRLRISAPDAAGMNDAQKAAIASVSSRPLTVLVGGAGTGKTAVVRHIAETVGHDRVALTATTGAAARILDPDHAETLHSFLGVVPGMIRSQRNNKVDVLVVDEASMLDILLAAPLGHFLANVGVGRLVVVGDPYQLPPVGPGRVLHDLINGDATKDCVVELSEIRRTKHAGILALAGAIRRDDRDAGRDATKHVQVEAIPSDTGAAVEALVDLAKQAKLADRLVITAEYGGALGVRNLNKVLRDVHLGESDDPWVVGQQVVQRKTRRVRVEAGRDDEAEHDAIVTNGTFGTVKTIGRHIEVVYADGLEVAWPAEACLPGQGIIDGAYALTVHRAQGTQAKTVLTVVDPERPGMWQDPALGYTAVTRATERLIVYGEVDGLFGDGERQVDRRRTDLGRRIQEAVLRRNGSGRP